jgi:hypothetical protein
MGGVGSGSWYRFDKKTTVDECRSLDVRRLHRQGLLKPGRVFAWSWSRQDGDGLDRGLGRRSGPSGAGSSAVPPQEEPKCQLGRR